MSIILKRTKNIVMDGVKLLAYGVAGVGKTSLIKTLPAPVILSAEAGLLSLNSSDIPYIEVRTIQELEEARRWLTSSAEAAQFQSVALDSISEIAEVVLADEKDKNKDGRKAYGAMQDTMSNLIRSFRDISGKHVYFSAKVEKTQDEMGAILYSPSLPGQKMSQLLPYFFDEVLAMRFLKDKDGVTHRALMTAGDGVWIAKDRSGKLDYIEQPDLGAIIRKIGGAKNA